MMDERIKGEFRKIYSELTSIIVVFAAIALFVKFNLYHMGLRECITEFVILIFSPLYLAVRQYMLGLDSGAAASKKQRKTAFLAAITGASVAFTASLLWQRKAINGDVVTELLIFIATFLFIYYTGQKLSAYFSEKRAKKYDD